MSPALSTLAILTLFFAVHVEGAVRGLDPKDLAEYTGAESFKCLDGSKQLSIDKVNDDFCDCRDGSDEPGTSACINGEFYCTNKGYNSLKVPSSRVNDGICDCCDGSDEWKLGVCEDICKETALEAYKDQIARIEVIKKGVKAKEALIREGEKMLKEKIAEKVEAEEKMKEIEERVNAAEELVAKLEAKEKPDNEAKEPDASETRLEASVQKAEPVKPGEPEKDFPYPKEYQAPKQEEEKFPYPKEYAAPTEGGDEKFPYPEEYAVPTDEKDDIDNIDEDEPEEPEEILEERKEETEELKKARDELRSIRSELDTWKESYNGANKFLQNLGEDHAFISMYHKCFERKARQYTYEVCLFKDAYQKEGGSRTRLGNFENFNQDSLTMEFKNGQTCWNGPARSMTVTLECGSQNELQHVDEPSKCVYRTTLKTPAVCDIKDAEDLEALMVKLSN